MIDCSKYYGLRYDRVSYLINSSQITVLEKAEILIRTGIDFLDEDVRVCARRVLDAADAASVTSRSIDLIRAAFASKRSDGRKSGRRPRDVKDIPILEEPIWETLGVSN